MKVSIIIAVYKDITALALVLETLKYQTYKDFEVIVVEDGSSIEVKLFVESVDNLEIKHTTQDDLGVRKARSQNNGIIASSEEYLIFIDGDCLLYSTFIEGHVSLAEKGYALSGRRLNLNQNLTDKLRKGDLKVIDIEKKLLWKYLYLVFDKSIRYEQGIYLKNKSWIYNKFFVNRKRNTAILGCNFSCWRDDIIALNGFDESYGETAIPDDMDWDWRFKAYGIKLKSCNNVANMMHLNHKIHDRGDATHQLSRMKSNIENNKYICKLGLNTHE